jgi:peroxiredoxin
MGTERTSFIIGPEGSVAHVLPRVKPDEHVGLILEAVGA